MCSVCSLQSHLYISETISMFMKMYKVTIIVMLSTVQYREVSTAMMSAYKRQTILNAFNMHTELILRSKKKNGA